jgi:hypothetical protein
LTILDYLFQDLRTNIVYEIHIMNAFLIKILKTGRREMDNKFLTQTLRHTFLQLYCGLSYQFVPKECFIKSNTITLNYNLSIAFIQIKTKS